MNIQSLKLHYVQNRILRLLLKPLVDIKNFLKFRIVSEEQFLKRKYKRTFGKDLNLESPETLNEKLQWLKLNDRQEFYSKISDKFLVREYLQEKNNKDLSLIPLLFSTSKAIDIVPENLPDYPFIIKTNHDSFGGIIVKDKNKVNWKKVQKELEYRLSKNYYTATKEWQYKNIPPKIIVEKLLIDPKGNIPSDYKFECFNGKVKMINVDSNKAVSHLRNNYDRNWNLLPFLWPAEIKNGPIIPKPINLERMINIAEDLAQDFIFVRVDLYDLETEIFFGELTLHPTSGFGKFEPSKYDLYYGTKLRLPFNSGQK